MERNAAQNMMSKYLEHSLKYLEMAGGRKNEKWRLFLINKFQWFLGPNHSIVLAGFDNLAIFHLEQNNYSKSEKILKQLMKTRKSQLPADHPQLAKTLATLANNYSHQKKYKLAENSYMKALKIRANCRGAYHVEVAHILLGMAWMYQCMGDYGQAESMYLKARTISERALGPFHHDVLKILYQLADLYLDNGELEKSEQLLKRVLKHGKKSWVPGAGVDMDQAQRNLARVHAAQGRQGGAGPNHENSLEDVPQPMRMFKVKNKSEGEMAGSSAPTS